jgi:hypothetical protein
LSCPAAVAKARNFAAADFFVLKLNSTAPIIPTSGQGKPRRKHRQAGAASTSSSIGCMSPSFLNDPAGHVSVAAWRLIWSIHPPNTDAHIREDRGCFAPCSY